MTIINFIERYQKVGNYYFDEEIHTATKTFALNDMRVFIIYYSEPKYNPQIPLFLLFALLMKIYVRVCITLYAIVALLLAPYAHCGRSSVTATHSVFPKHNGRALNGRFQFYYDYHIIIQ